MIEFSADKVNLTVVSSETITSGSVGVYICKFSFSDDWAGFLRIAVFRSAGQRWEAALNESDMCVIPWEATQTPYSELTVGVYGITNSGKVLPTVWASLGTVQSSPRKCKNPCPPSANLTDNMYAPIAAVTFTSLFGNPTTAANCIDFPIQGLTIYGMAKYDNDNSNMFNSATITENMWIETETAEWAQTAGFWTSDYVPVVPGEPYYLSCEGGRGSSRAAFYDDSKNPVRYAPMSEGSFVPQDGEVYFAFCGTEDSYNRVMLNAGEEPLPWSPFVGDPAPDNPVPIEIVGEEGVIDVVIGGDTSKQSTTLHVPGGLAGVQVDTGGNCVRDGVQYLCDTYSFPSGKITRYIGHIISYNGEDVGEHYICTTGELTNGAEVYYVMPEPVEVEPNEDLGAYSTLRTYNGNTSVSTTDANAIISFKYVGDVQKYIDDLGVELFVVDAEVSADNELILTFNDGSKKNLGVVGGGGSGAVYVPHIDERKILTFTIEESPSEVPGPVDLNPFDEWEGIEGSDLMSDYIWEEL